MKHSSRAVRALFSFRAGRKTFYVLPLTGLGYGLLSLVIVALALTAIDRVMLGSLERAGWTSGQLWQRHNRLIEENNRLATTTNECQLRHWAGQPLPASEPASRTILVLGDSFVWGPPYQSLNHLWWRQLAIELERRGYRGVQVVAAGHPGWSTRRELECLTELLPEVKPDLVIWGYVTNDPDEKLVPQISDFRDRGPFPFRVRVQLRRLWPNLMFKFESARADNLAAHYAGPKYGYTYDQWCLKLLEGENFARYRTTVAEAGQFLHESNTPCFLMTLPHWPSRGYHQPRYAPVLPLWTQAGVKVHNPLDEMIRRYGDAPPTGPEALAWGINPADSHPGPRLTHFYAESAADFIEHRWPDVLGAKVPAAPHELAINDWLPPELNVRSNGSTFALTYPRGTEHMPTLPLDVPAAQVALRYPLPLSAIRLSGQGLRGVRLWASTLHPAEQYDQSQWRELTRQDGPDYEFRLPADLAGQTVTCIRIAAEIAGSDRELRLTLQEQP